MSFLSAQTKNARRALRFSLQKFVLLDDLNLAAHAALAINHLAAARGPHASTETVRTGTFTLGNLTRIMHRSPHKFFVGVGRTIFKIFRKRQNIVGQCGYGKEKICFDK